MRKIGYVLGSFPVLSETFVGNEIRAVELVGHPVAAFIMQRRHGAAQPGDMELADRSLDLRMFGASDAASAFLMPREGASAAMDFCLQQKMLPRRSLFWNGLKLASALGRARCSHVHAHFAGGAAAHAIFAARWIGASVSFICHGHDVYAEPEDLALKLASADAAIAVCDDMADDLRSIAPTARIERIACGVDASIFQQLPVEAEGQRFLFVGRLVACKGVDDILTALGETPADVGVDIVGDGPLRAPLETSVREKGLADRVTFLGAQDRNWLAREAPRYRGLVCPFKPDADGTKDTGPVVVKEAMAMGLPVLSTRQMGLKETVTHETGILVEPGDAGALASALTSLSRMTGNERREMGLRGRQRVLKHFTLEQQAALLSQLFEAA